MAVCPTVGQEPGPYVSSAGKMSVLTGKGFNREEKEVDVNYINLKHQNSA